MDLNPLGLVKEMIDGQIDKAKLKIKIELMEEAAVMILSRLAMLNSAKTGSYHTAIQQIEKD